MRTGELGPSLVRALTSVPDPWSRHGLRHPLPAVSALGTVAMLCGARSLYAIAQWGQEQPPEVVQVLASQARTWRVEVSLNLIVRARSQWGEDG